MKAPLLFTATILGATLWLGWLENQRATVLGKRQHELRLLARSSGLSPQASGSTRARNAREGKVKNFADRLTAAAARGKAPGVPEAEAFFLLHPSLSDEWLGLNSGEMEEFILLLMTAAHPDEATRRDIVFQSLWILAQQDPAKALEALAGVGDFLPSVWETHSIRGIALSSWAADDPSGALDWLRKNRSILPEFFHTDLTRQLVSGTISHDIPAAMSLAEEFGLSENIWQMLSSRAGSIPSAQEQQDFLNGIRTYVASSGGSSAVMERVEKVQRALFADVARKGFAPALSWMTTANLTSGEKERFARSLSYRSTGADTGAWLDWISTHPPADPSSLRGNLQDMVMIWTMEDPVSAKQWLVSARPGQMKEDASLFYLRTIAPYDSEAATQWAFTLPGEKQSHALKMIYGSLKEKDFDAAVTFADKHGIPR